MPGRKRKPPRLEQRRSGEWIIRDGDVYQRTGSKGSDASSIARAAERLAEYIARRHRPASGERDPDRLPIADVLSAYEQAKAPAANALDRERVRRHEELLSRLERVNEFFGELTVGEIRSQHCRDFVAWRCQEKTARELERRDLGALPARRAVTSSSARRELEDLRAAINCWHADFSLRVVPKITLPAKANARARWLTRPEAARLIAAALGFYFDEAGRLAGRRDRWTQSKRRHIARFILLGLYSGRREKTIRRTQWIASPVAPWFDLERGIYHGRGEREAQTKKRRPPAPIAWRLAAHLKRWQRLDLALADELGRPVLHVIHKRNGEPLSEKIKRGWSAVLVDAGLGPEVVRHVLKHTAGTWLMQRGVAPWQAAGFLGITVDQLDAAYAHQDPGFQESAAAAFGGRAPIRRIT